MSNHHHLVVTDTNGLLPVFLRELHRSVAKALNALHGQWENLWAAEQTSVVELTTDETVINKIAYVVTNPVQAGLVESPQDWPGILLWEDSVCETARPAQYFDPHGSAPPTISLRIVSCPHVAGAADTSTHWNRRVESAIAERVRESRRTPRAQRLGFVGAKAVLAQSFLERPTTREEKRTGKPRIAASRSDAKDATIRSYRAFLTAYRSALEKWREGVRETVFPAGTWWMQVHHRVATDMVPTMEPAAA